MSNVLLMTIFSTIITPVITGIVLWFITHRYEQKEDQRAAVLTERADIRKKENHLSMELSFAVMKMSYANSMAILRGAPNGEVEEALEIYKNAEKKYFDFINHSHIDMADEQ